MNTLEILRTAPFFKDLDASELDAVAQCVAPVRVRAGQVVIHEGAAGESLYIVQSGRLRIEKMAGGRRLDLGELGPGAAFGEMSLIDSVPTSATVTAADDSDLLGIGRLDLNVLLNWNPILAAKMWRSFTLMLSLRLRDMNDRMLSRYGEEALREA